MVTLDVWMHPVTYPGHFPGVGKADAASKGLENQMWKMWYLLNEKQNGIWNIVVSFPEAVRDNVVSDDVTITSSLLVIILAIYFLFS